MPPPGDSATQRQAEAVLIAGLGYRLGAHLAPRRIFMTDGTRVEVDGVCDDPPILSEAWAHHGPPKPAQRNKVLADALKLVALGRLRTPRPRLILCFADADAARPFTSPAQTWYAEALREFQVEVQVVALPDDVREQIRHAQTRQYR